LAKCRHARGSGDGHRRLSGAALRPSADHRRSQSQREANANELWRETLRLGFDNRKLSDPSLKLADFDYDKLTIDGSRELFQKYEIYVDTVLNASDEILEISPTEDWKTSLRIQLLPHRDYLLSPHFKQSGYLNQYGANLRSFLPEILNEP